nr:RidA family protein [Rhizobium leguminosarum]
MVPCVNPVIVICRSLVRQQHQQSHADPEGGAKAPLTIDPSTGKIKGETIQEQTHQCLTNISAILKESGSSLDKVVSATVIMLEEEDFAGMNEEWLSWFPIDPPARQGAKLPVRVPGMKISVAVIAEA